MLPLIIPPLPPQLRFHMALQIQKMMGAQTTDALATGSSQQEKAETPGDVADCLQVALTYNLTNLISGASLLLVTHIMPVAAMACNGCACCVPVTAFRCCFCRVVQTA